MRKFVLNFCVILVIASGIFSLISYVRNNKENKNDKTVQEQKPDEIVVTDLPTGEKLVENRTAGFKTEIPIGFEINSQPVNYHLKAIF